MNMKRKTLSLKVKRNSDTEQVDEAAKDVSHDDPQKSFSNGVAINPYQCIRLEQGSQELTTRAIERRATAEGPGAIFAAVTERQTRNDRNTE